MSYQTTRRYNPEDSHIRTEGKCSENTFIMEKSTSPVKQQNERVDL
jgi:hypothetical protein